MRKITSLIVLVIFASFLSACSINGRQVEKLGEDAQESVENAVDAATDAVDAVVGTNDSDAGTEATTGEDSSAQ